MRRFGRPAVVVVAVALAACAGSHESAKPPAFAETPVAAVPTASITPPPAVDRPQAQAAKAVMLLPVGQPSLAGAMARSLKQAGELALMDHAGAPLDLSVKDDGGTPDGAARAAADAIQEGSDLIIGPMFSPSVVAVSGVAQSARVPVLAFSNDRAAARPGVFILGIRPEDRVERLIAYAGAHGTRRVLALLPEGPYGRLLEGALRGAGRRSQVEPGLVVHFEGLQGIADPVKALADEVARAPAQAAPETALLLAADRDSLPTVLAALAAAKLDAAHIRTLALIEVDAIDKVAPVELAGAWIAASDPARWQDFEARFRKAFGSPPPRLAAMAYDAVCLAIEAKRTAPSAAPVFDRPRGLTAADLIAVPPLNGGEGSLQLKPDGLSERALAVVELGTNGSRIVDPPAVVSAPPPDLVAAPAPKPFTSTN